MSLPKNRISTTSKLDGIRSWSLPAIRTCPGARGDDGELVEVCSGCYATEGRYRFPAVINVRAANMESWKDPYWVDQMAAALHNDRFFRWFDSGDIYRVNLAKKILAVVRRTPWCKHWIPTRSHKILGIREVLDTIAREPNAVVRYSTDTVDDFDPELHRGIVLGPDARVPDGVFECRARDTKPVSCNGCRACWDDDVAIVGYRAHGSKLIRLIEAQ